MSEKPWVKDLAIFSAITTEVVGLPWISLWLGQKLTERFGLPSFLSYLFALLGFVVAILRMRRYRKK